MPNKDQYSQMIPKYIRIHRFEHTFMNLLSGV